MKTLHRRRAGLDVHKDTVVACVRRQHGNKIEHDVRTFSTMTLQLIQLWEWLEKNQCTVDDVRSQSYAHAASVLESCEGL